MIIGLFVDNMLHFTGVVMKLTLRNSFIPVGLMGIVLNELKDTLYYTAYNYCAYLATCINILEKYFTEMLSLYVNIFFYNTGPHTLHFMHRPNAQCMLILNSFTR